MSKKDRLERVTITRRKDGFWDVTRERKTNGETMGQARTLEECFEFVRCIYDDKGELKSEAPCSTVTMK